MPGWSVFHGKWGLKAFHPMLELVRQRGPAKRRQLAPGLYLLRRAATSDAPFVAGIELTDVGAGRVEFHAGNIGERVASRKWEA